MTGLREQAKIRGLEATDVDEVVRIDALHTGEAKPEYWRRIFSEYLGRGGRDHTLGIGIDGAGGLAAYLFGEVRAVEFGSSACGWVFAVGVDDDQLRRHLGSALLADARERFAQLGISTMRTMVSRNDVPVQAFFRSNGFVGGSYVQLELGPEPEQER